MMTGPAIHLMFAATDSATAPAGSPGLIGFLVTLALVLACIPLFRSMTSKVRGVQFRDRVDDVAAAGSAAAGSAAEGSAAEGSAGATGSTPGRSDSSPATDAG